MTDIKEIKRHAEDGFHIHPDWVLELIDRLEAAEKDAAKWRDLVSHQKFNNKPQVGYAINRTNDRMLELKEKQDAAMKGMK